MFHPIVMYFCLALSSLVVSGSHLGATSGPTFGPTVKTQEVGATQWKGTLDARGTKLRLEIEISDASGKLKGTLRSLDQNTAKLDLENVMLDAKALSFSIPKINAKFKGKLNREGTSAKGKFKQSGISLDLTLTKGDDASKIDPKKPEGKLQSAWVGKVNMGLMKPVMQFRVVEFEDGKTQAFFDSVTEGATDFEATWSIDGDQLKFDVAKIKLKYRGTLDAKQNSAKGIWSQGGRDLELTLKKQATAYSDSNQWENRPQRPQGPYPYTSQEVTIENKADDLTLAGTLTLPNQPGRHPVVVLISGSGPQDRDESLMEHKPFLVLADYLSRRGIAVLRYDDRGTAGSTGSFGAATTEDFAKDASAAVEFLKQHDRINPEEIGLVGHSEGGLIAPMVVGLRDDISLVVLLAATGVDGVDISISQTEAMSRAAGVNEDEIALALRLNRAVLAVVATGVGGDELSQAVDKALAGVIETIPESEREEVTKVLAQEVESQKASFERPWLRFFLTYDPRPALSKIDCPVLAIIGSKDTQVLPDLNMPEIKKALEKGGNQDFEMIEVPGLNHLFQACETGAMGEYRTIAETFNPKALKHVGDWISQRVTIVK
ncbi:MAG: pimeloyl-ACP methyl ester carboxylesterase [Mariniblastus sp.]|jgi:pimeloyl-ACP methyl ester carboxylesterase